MIENKTLNENNEAENNNQQQIQVPFVVHESMLARMERQIKRLWVALIIAIAVIAITNIGWLYYESTFETISYSQDGEGMNNINTGEQGDLYGAESQNSQAEKSNSEESQSTQG